MTRLARRGAVLLAGASLALACRSGPPDSVEGGTKNLEKRASAKPAPPLPPASARPVVGGPASASAPRAERELAVMALLRGEALTAGLPVDATDNGQPVDPSVRDRLAPHKIIVSVPSGPHRPSESGPRDPLLSPERL